MFSYGTPTRKGWVRDPYCEFHSYPAGNFPVIHNKIDGPMLVYRNGECHYLTLWERLQVWLGYTDAADLERKHKPALELEERAICSSRSRGPLGLD